MRALLVFGLSILLLGAGCSEKEGILLNTSSDMSEPIHSLSFFVGADTIAEEGFFTQAKVVQDVLVDDRDLASDPFKLFLSPPSDSEDSTEELVVGVVAYNERGDVVGFGYSDTLRFVSGKVLEWDVSVRALDSESGLQQVGDCLKWRIGSPGMYDWIHIGGELDKDCDGVRTDAQEPDCDDTNPKIRPGIEERCGNAIDDNCNQMIDGAEDVDGDGHSPCAPTETEMDCDDHNNQVYPALYESCGTTVWGCDDGSIPLSNEGDRCFATDKNGDCFEGALVCSDIANDESLTYCLIDNEMPALKVQCEAYEDCDEPNPLVCVPDVSPPLRGGMCSISYFQFGEPSDICLGPNNTQVAIVKIPNGPQDCDRFQLRNDDSIVRWVFNIDYEQGSGDENCNMAYLSVAPGDLEQMLGGFLYIDAMKGENVVLESYKLEISSTESTSCEGSSLTCADSNGPWVPIAAP